MNDNNNKWYNGTVEDEKDAKGFWDLAGDMANILCEKNSSMKVFNNITGGEIKEFLQECLYNMIKYRFNQDIKSLYNGKDYLQ